MKKSPYPSNKPLPITTVNIENRTTVSTIEKIIYDPISRKSNISKVAKQLNNFVQQNFKTLSNCISSLILPVIQSPIAPQLSDPFHGQNPMVTMMQFFQLQASQTPMQSSQSSTTEHSSKLAQKSTLGVSTRSQTKASDDPEEENEQPTVPLLPHSLLSPTASTFNPLPTPLPVLDPFALPDAVKLSIYTTQYNQYCERIQLQRDELSNLYGLIMGILSTSSKELVWTNTNIDILEASRNGFELWKIIYTLHRCGNNQQSTSYYQDDVIQRYFNLHQRYNQELDDYFESFKEIIKNYAEMQIPTPTIPDQIIRFLKSLNRDLFSELHREINNHPTMNIQLFTTLQEAYSYASHYQPSTYSVKNETSVKNVYAIGTIKTKHCSIHNSSTHSTEECSKNKDSIPKKAINQTPRNFPGKASVSPAKTPATNSGLSCAYHKQSNTHSTENCEVLKKYKAQEKTNAIIEYELFTEFEIDLNVQSHQPLENQNLVHLDSAAQISVFNNENLLTNIEEAEPIKIFGVNRSAAPIITSRAGYLKHFSHVKVYFSKEVKKNILRLGEVRKHYEVTWDNSKNAFTILDDTNFLHIFSETNQIYSSDFSSISSPLNPLVMETVCENKTKFSANEIKRADLVRTISKRLAFESDTGLAKAVREGSILGLPINLQDIQNAQTIYGQNISALKGNSTKSSIHLVEDRVNKCPEKMQTFISDIMFVCKQPFLITVSVPLGLTTVDHLQSYCKESPKSSKILATSIINQILAYKAQGFHVIKIINDRESGITAIESLINDHGAILEQEGSQTHSTNVIDRKIRFIKERVRAIINELPFPLPSQLLKWCIYFAVSRINLISHSGHGTISPREQFCGQRTNYDKDVRIAFGDYAQVHDPTSDNTMKPRTIGALALLPSGSKSGSVYFYLLASKKVVSREQFTIIPTPIEVVEIMKSLANPTISNPEFIFKNTVIENLTNENEQQSPLVPLAQEYAATVNIPPSSSGRHVSKTDHFQDVSDSESIEETHDSIEETHDSMKENSDSFKEDIVMIHPPSQIYFSNHFENQVLPSKTRSGKLFPTVLNVSVDQALIEDPILAHASILRELNQMVDKNVWTPVKQKDVKQKRIIPCKMFLKKKKIAGNDDWKSRLVGGGHRQIREAANDNYSPTAHIHSIFLLAMIAAMFNLFVCTLDITGAYLNAEMTSDVYVRIPPQLSRILIGQHPYYGDFINLDNTIVVKLKKALYGCIESAKLWYLDISQFLISIGFTMSENDACIFFKFENGIKIYVALFVDDFKIICKDLHLIQQLESSLKLKYKELTSVYGSVHKYLGMEFNYSNGKVLITMKEYIQKLLTFYNIVKRASTPAANDLFIPGVSPLLPANRQEFLHSGSAKLLYLSTRVRPDIALPVNYLCSRVNQYNQLDEDKFFRILYYLKETIDEGLNLSCSDPIPTIHVYADASYGINADRKSQTGIIVQVGQATILAKTGKQKIVTKSSTEAEIVAACDAVSSTHYIKALMDELQFETSGIVVHQDNMSAITMINNNRPTSQRTKHIDIKYFFLRDRSNTKDITIIHTPTQDMVADILTKPIQSSQFQKLKALLLNG